MDLGKRNENCYREDTQNKDAHSYDMQNSLQTLDLVKPNCPLRRNRSSKDMDWSWSRNPYPYLYRILFPFPHPVAG